MKKLIVSILAVLYLGSSAGATVHLHYCMGKLVNWNLSDEDGDKCDNCGMEKDDGCCKDEHQFIKNSVDQKTAESSIQLLQITTCTTPIAFTNELERYSSSLIENYPLSHAPPLETGVDVLIHNCVFRI